MAIAVEATARQ